MKKILSAKVVAMAAFAFAFCANAAKSSDYWAAVNTGAYSGDASPSTASVKNYEAYYCTAVAAQTMFNATTVDGINGYLLQNFAAGKTAMGSTAGSFAIDESGYFERNQYTFIEYASTGVASDTYLAVVFYQNEAFRVFGSDNAVLVDGKLVFDDATGVGTVGDWTTVPEPTSGTLALFALAALALKRRRVVRS